MEMDTDLQMDVEVVGSDEDVDFIDADDVSTYNPDNILPETPQVIDRIRKWLQPTSYNIEDGEHRSLAPATSEYAKWHDGRHHGLLWIKGIPGSGKSVFAASLAHDLAKEGHPVLFFFFRQIIDANHKPFNLLCDWLDQILEYSPPLQKMLKAYVGEESDTRRALDSVGKNDMWMHLKTALAQTVGRVYLVADALVEMDSGNDEFLRELAMLGSWKPAKVKVLITSRPVATVEEPLRRMSTLQIRLEEPEDQIRIKEAVPGRANGLFLYAKLAMDAFLEPNADIHQVLNALPLDLNAMYTDLLREHAHRSRVPGGLQLLILSWVTHATRPLRLLELAAIIRTTYDDADMEMKEAKRLARAACGPLLEIQPDETVSVVHHSLTEFLLGSTRSADAASYPVLTLGPTHERLALSCLQYLSAGCLDDIKVTKTKENSPYLDYAPEWKVTSHSSTKLRYAFVEYDAENWTIHAAKSARAGLSSELVPPLLDRFLTPGPRFDAWLEMYVKILADRPDTVLDCLDVLKQTPLYHAADRGQHETVRVLIDAGANPNPDNYAGLKPLHQAARLNHAAVVAVLLASGVDPLTPKTRENPGRRCGNGPTTTGHTPLMYACQAGHLEALESFLPYLTDSKVHRALCWAIQSRRFKLIRRLIQLPGIDLNANVHGNTLFFEACLAGDVKSMESLVEAGADASMLSSYGCRSPLNAFCQGLSGGCRNRSLPRTEVDLVKRGLDLLIQAGADVNRRDGDMSVPLHRATANPVLLRLLLEAGADPNAEDTQGSTLLHTPRTDEEGFAVNRVLVEEGKADVNKRRKDGKTPLMIYLEGYDVKACIQFLEDFCPDCTLTDNEGNGPLHLAHPAIVAFFVKHGCDIDARDHSGDTPLTRLTRGRRSRDSLSEAMDEFLKLGASIHTRDYKGRTLLHKVITTPSSHQCTPGQGSTSSLDNLSYLVSLGLDLKVVDYSGNTVLHELIANGHKLKRHLSDWILPTTFNMLIVSGVDPEAANYSGRTILHLLHTYCQKSGTLAHVKPTLDLVLTACQNIDAADHTGVCPIHLAASESEVLTSRLIEAGADVSVATHKGLTPLHISAEAKQSNILGVLLTAIATGKYGEKQTIIDAAEHHPRSWPHGPSTRTPLYYACRSGRPESVALLLNAGAEVARESANLLAACSSFETAERDLLRSQQQDRSDRHDSDSEAHLITTRLDEILEMLAHHGLRISDWTAVGVACNAAIQSKSNYTAFCLAQILLKTTEQTEDAFWVRWSCLRQASAIRAFEETDAVSMVKDDLILQAQWLDQFLSAREFGLIERMYSVDDGGCDPAKFPRSGQSALHILTSFGYRGLLAKLAKEVDVKNLDDETWRRNQEDGGDPGPGSVIPLVLTACQRVLPNMEVLRFLVEELGASVNAHHIMHGWKPSTQSYGYYVGNSPLHYLSHGKHWWHVYQALPYLLSQRANPNARDGQGDTPLHRALDTGSYSTGIFNQEAVRVLLDAGACVDAANDKGVSCLDVAIESGDRELIQLLMAHGPRITATSMFSAVENEQIDLLELLLSAGGDPNTPRQMLKAAEPGNRTRRGIRYTTRPDDYLLYYTATKYPKRQPKTLKDGTWKIQELVGILLAYGADPFVRIWKSSNEIENTGHTTNADKPEALHETFVLHEILHHGGVPWPFLDLPGLDFERRNSEGQSFLLASCTDAKTFNCQRVGVRSNEESGVEEFFIESLLQKGAKPTALDNSGRNALHILLRSTPLSDMVVKTRPFRVLVEEMSRLDGALIDQPDPVEGQTPLHLALYATVISGSGTVKNWEEVIDVLLSAGADVSRADNAGNTCLHLLAPGLDRDATHRKLFQRFLDMGLDVNAANKKGETPAFHYLGQGRRERKAAWQWLVDCGAEPTVKDSRGRGLLHVVAEHEVDVVLFAKLTEKWGLDPMAADNERIMSSLDVAAACSNSSVISLFGEGEGGGLVERARAMEKALRKCSSFYHYYDDYDGED
ncbi:ankyrin repeat-containing domain protein [Apiosordaria backusii]|uniref:Ankyrin repeat-containing domain protein n=1 Tax=Apiosordaria backusii TaxID=314023 RepID=A0AA39ZPD5_9PEZI|nr:ankyrin repeat-containing domain protein [Apiosordaria backusii]